MKRERRVREKDFWTQFWYLYSFLPKEREKKPLCLWFFSRCGRWKRKKKYLEKTEKNDEWKREREKEKKKFHINLVSDSKVIIFSAISKWTYLPFFRRVKRIFILQFLSLSLCLFRFSLWTKNTFNKRNKKIFFLPRFKDFGLFFLF